MMIIAPDLALHISSTLDFSFVQVLVQDLLFNVFPKVMTSLEDNTKCAMLCAMYLYRKIKDGTLFNWFIFFNLVLRHFGSVKSFE